MTFLIIRSCAALPEWALMGVVGTRVIARKAIQDDSDPDRLTLYINEDLEMPTTSVVHDAIDDIKENLWILQDKALHRITGWFLAIDKAGYDRGYQRGKAQPALPLSNDQMVIVLRGLALRRKELERFNPDLKEIQQIIDLEQELQTVLAGVPVSVS